MPQKNNQYTIVLNFLEAKKKLLGVDYEILKKFFHQLLEQQQDFSYKTVHDPVILQALHNPEFVIFYQGLMLQQHQYLLNDYYNTLTHQLDQVNQNHLKTITGMIAHMKSNIELLQKTIVSSPTRFIWQDRVEYELLQTSEE